MKETIKENNEIINYINKSNDFIVSDISKALTFAQKAYKLAQKKIDTRLIAISLKQMAICCQHTTNYVGTMKYVLEAIDLFKAIQHLEGEAECLNILGGVYNFLEDYEKRLSCNLECLALRKQINNERAILSSLNNIGDTYLSMKDYDSALNYFYQCLSFPDLPDDILAIVTCNIAEVYFYKKDYNLAIENNTKAKRYATKSKYFQIISSSDVLSARISLVHHDFKIAENHLTEALQLIAQKSLKEQELEVYQLFSELYQFQSKFELAHKFLKKYIRLKEEIISNNSSQKIKKIEFDIQLKSITDEAMEIKEKNEMLTKAFRQIEIQSNEIGDKNKSIIDSIYYAKRIQFAILPEKQKVEKCLENYFIFYLPKDIVSGDFYWVEQIENKIIFAVIDCTGHGVPGAFMSLIGHNALNRVVLENHTTTPGEILNEMNRIITDMFEKSEEKIRDGMDMGICCWDKKLNTIQFAGAFNSLFILRENGFFEDIKGNRQSIGASIYEIKPNFLNHTIKINKGDSIYLSTDGFPDQFGGEKGKKLKWKGLKNLLQSLLGKTIDEQNLLVSNYFYDWKRNLDQLDDVCLIGININ